MRALLLSGGIDSTCLAYWLKPEIAVIVNYGQKAFLGELRASQKIAEEMGINHYVIEADISSLGSGDMSSAENIDVAPSSEWWPYRNQYIITVAAMKMISMGVKELICGSVMEDSFHVDGTEAFYEMMDSLIKSQEGGMRVRAPAVNMSAVDLVKTSGIPMSLLGWAHSCHKSEFACDDCRGCAKFHNVMYQLGAIV